MRTDKSLLLLSLLDICLTSHVSKTDLQKETETEGGVERESLAKSLHVVDVYILILYFILRNLFSFICSVLFKLMQVKRASDNRI